MRVIEFLREEGVALDTSNYSKTVKHEVFEENNGSIKLVKFLKTKTMTKHITIKYQYFRFFFDMGIALTEKVETTE